MSSYYGVLCGSAQEPPTQSVSTMPGAVGPKDLEELTEGPRPLPGGGVGHAPAGRPQSVMRLPQWCCPPDGANSAAWNSRLWVARKYTRRIRPLPIHYTPPPADMTRTRPDRSGDAGHADTVPSSLPCVKGNPAACRAPLARGRVRPMVRAVGRRLRPIHRPWPFIARTLWAGVARRHPPYVSRESALAGV